MKKKLVCIKYRNNFIFKIRIAKQAIRDVHANYTFELHQRFSIYFFNTNIKDEGRQEVLWGRGTFLRFMVEGWEHFKTKTHYVCRLFMKMIYIQAGYLEMKHASPSPAPLAQGFSFAPHPPLAMGPTYKRKQL